ncbi:hypothetical protein B0H10DRAFT_723310 [Mycena sp. CBHHK59/15]|nr:hypothetical protein B0H10DRAFT_723310 [Mycena sp. CBHHK59/15]
MLFSKFVLPALAFLAVSSAAPADLTMSSDVAHAGLTKSSDVALAKVNTSSHAGLTTSFAPSGLTTPDSESFTSIKFVLITGIIITIPYQPGQCLSVSALATVGVVLANCTSVTGVGVVVVLFVDVGCSGDQATSPSQAQSVCGT